MSFPGESLLGQSESVLKYSIGSNNARPACSPICFKYHSRTLFVNPGVIIWNETAISCYSDLAPAISAGRGLRKRETGRDRE